jgi:hypothetical protein
MRLRRQNEKRRAKAPRKGTFDSGVAVRFDLKGARAALAASGNFLQGPCQLAEHLRIL